MEKNLEICKKTAAESYGLNFFRSESFAPSGLRMTDARFIGFALGREIPVILSFRSRMTAGITFLSIMRGHTVQVLRSWYKR